jgi:dienelactone hydrolase
MRIRLLLMLFATTAAAQTPPPQPAHGPGSSDYAHTGVATSERGGAQGWRLFTPTGPAPTSAPVVVFCHGWGALDSKTYQAWIDHLVHRGNIVIWPNYQDSLRTPAAQFLPNALAGVRGALASLRETRGTLGADLQRVAVVGHSAGGLLAAELAAVAKAEGLPEFRAVMPVEPGDGSQGGKRRASVPLVDLTPMPASTHLLVFVGADDHRAFEALGLHIYDAARDVPTTHKNVLELRSDAHGNPSLVANHSVPAGTFDGHAQRRALLADFEHAGMVDALDFALWKHFDALTDCAFAGHNCDIALGGSAAQTTIGRWSDGVEVQPLRVLR